LGKVKGGYGRWEMRLKKKDKSKLSPRERFKGDIN
jgi:hypothetical protein